MMRCYALRTDLSNSVKSFAMPSQPKLRRNRSEGDTTALKIP